MMKYALIIIFIRLLVLSNSVFAQDIELNVLDGWVEWSNAQNMLNLHINKQAFLHLDKREEEISKLVTQGDWENRQEKIKKKLMQIAGVLPEKTPLNPRVTGIIQKDGFRIEKIIFESMPNFYVTGCLFIPDNINGKRPAILNPIGHTMKSFRSSIKKYYQPLILNLVKKGFIVFAIDPVGQAERKQLTNEEKFQIGLKANKSTQEHSYVNNQCLLSGYSTAKYFIWDGIRAIDYLITRAEVDAERIGVTGLSGGGMATAYLAAFDERVKAAAPAAYICGYRRLMESIGPQDGEQNFYHGIKNGVDHADLIEIFAPKPYLIVSTTRDFFSIQGARETFKEVSIAYRAFGKEENLKMVEDDFGHGYTRKNREAIYKFFQESLKLPGSPEDMDIELLQSEELKVTTTGQVMTSFDCETISSLNKKETEELLKNLEESRKDLSGHLIRAKASAIKLSGYMAPDKNVKAVYRGRHHQNGYTIEMYGLEGEGEYVIPVLLYIPEGSSEFPAIIYLHPDGKAAHIYKEGPIEDLVKKGFIVAVPDLIGIGETGPGNAGYNALLIGRSIVGFQAADIVRITYMLQNRNDVVKDKIGAVSFNDLCPALLHAAAFDQSLSNVALINPLISYKEIVNNRLYNYSLSFKWGVAGALTAYDLPCLAGAVAPRKLFLINIKDNMKKMASKECIESELEFTRKVFAKRNASANLIVEENHFDEYYDTIKNWWKN